MIFFKRQYLLLLLLVISLSSCQKIMLRYYGVKQPKEETASSLYDYLRKRIAVDSQQIAHFTGYQQYAEFGPEAPEVYIFNREGYRLRYKPDSIDCSGGLTLFLEQWEQMDKLDIDSSLQLSDWTPFFQQAFSQKSYSMAEDSDYVFFIFWGKCLGRINQSAYDWYEQIEAINAKGKERLELQMIAVDPIEGWEKPEK